MEEKQRYKVQIEFRSSRATSSPWEAYEDARGSLESAQGRFRYLCEGSNLQDFLANYIDFQSLRNLQKGGRVTSLRTKGLHARMSIVDSQTDTALDRKAFVIPQTHIRLPDFDFSLEEVRAHLEGMIR